jgi:hypothetical protein
VSASQIGVVEDLLELDLDQELILIRRFQDAVAALTEESRSPGTEQSRAQQEFERSWRMATNMRGRIR